MSSKSKNSVELGSIEYVNLTKDRNHGEYQIALDEAKRTGKPIFANFVEWPGGQGCRDAGKIFQDPAVVKAAEELFVPCAFNTYDRYNKSRSKPMKAWGAGLANSGWGYLRIIDTEGKNVISGTHQILSYKHLNEVKEVMREAMVHLGIPIPDYLK